MRISDWSSDVCSSDLRSRSRGIALISAQPFAHRTRYERVSCCRPSCISSAPPGALAPRPAQTEPASDRHRTASPGTVHRRIACFLRHGRARSEEHTSELQSLMRISYAVFCLKKKKHKTEAET